MMAALGAGLVLLMVVILAWAVAASVRQHRLQVEAERKRREALEFSLLRDEVFRVEARRRQRLREELVLHDTCARSIADLTAWIQELPAGAPQTKLKQTVAIAAAEDRAALNLGREGRTWWPSGAPTPTSPTDTETLTHLDKVVRMLDSHSLAVAGGEQVFLSLLATPQLQPDALSVAIQHFGGVLPAPLHEAAATLIHSVLPGSAAGFVQANAGEILHGIVFDFGLRALEHSGTVGSFFTVAEMLNVVRDGTAHGIGAGLAHGIEVHGAHLVQAMEHAAHLDGIVHGLSIGDVGGAHFPIITAMIALHREYRLLEEDKTSIDVALKNAGLDVAGAGIGAAAGAKAGAIAGTIAIPIPVLGTAIGGVVGAAGGAVLGRLFTNEVKLRPLKKCVALYEHEWCTAPGRIQALQQTLSKTVLDEYAERRKAFIGALKPMPTRQANADDWRTVAVNVRNTARRSTGEARSLLATGRHWANNDHELTGNIAILEPALIQVDTALLQSEERLAKRDYPLSILSVVDAPIRLPGDECISCDSALVPLVDEQRVAVANWMVGAAHQFKTQKQLFEQTVAPCYRTYQEEQDRVVAAVKEAAAEVKRRRDELGE